MVSFTLFSPYDHYPSHLLTVRRERYATDERTVMETGNEERIRDVRGWAPYVRRFQQRNRP